MSQEFIFIYFAHSRDLLQDIMEFTLYVEDDSNNLVINCLELTAIRRTRDMSVANVIRTIAFFPYREIESVVGKDITLTKYCSPRVESVTENEVTVCWGEKSYTLHPGDDIETEEYAIDNPYLSWDGISLNIKYSNIKTWDGFIDLCNEITQDQKEYPARENKEEKEKCLKLLNEIILNGEKSLKPIYAWLQSCENWSTMRISDYALFAKHFDIADSAEEESSAWFSNLAQILRANSPDAVVEAVPSLKAVIESEANEEIQEAIKNRIEEFDRHICERHNPDHKEFILKLKMYDEEDEVNACHFQWVTTEQLKSGEKIDMGDFGEVTILAVENGKVKLSWLGNGLEVEDDDMEYFLDSRPKQEGETDAEEEEDINAWAEKMFYTPTRYLLCTLKEMNLWHETSGVIDEIVFNGLGEAECQLEWEQYIKVAKQLLKVLIDRGDKGLEVLHDMITVDSNFDEIKELIDSIE